MSMFPHKVTLIKKTNNGYAVEVVSGVYCDESRTRNLNGKEMEKGGGFSIVAPISKESSFVLGDYVLKGAYNISVTSVADLEDYAYSTIVSKAVYDVGSSIDNVVIQCQ